LCKHPPLRLIKWRLGRRVVWLADGERYLYVEKSLARYPVQAITRIEAPTGPPDGLR
jgi:hypothetical protein